MNVPSSVGALIIPSSKKKAVFSDFEWLKRKWGFSKTEVKGSKLDETQVAQAVEMLKKYDVLFEVSVIDMEYHPDDALADFKSKSVAGITESLTPEHLPEIIAEVNNLARSVNAMSNPLFVQAVMLQYLIPRTLQHGLLYYARRIPEELARFYWTIDAKQSTIIDYERAWSLLIYATMSTASLSNPVWFAEGGDYSYFDRFIEPVEEDDEFLGQFGLSRDEIRGISLKMVLGEYLKFQDSKNSIGLQLADIVTTSTRRALKGTLGETGWGEIGRLMLAKRQPNGKLLAIEPIRFNLYGIAGDTSYGVEASKHVYATFISKTKPMLKAGE